MNRLEGFYPIIRGATNILLRDLSTTVIVDAVVSGKGSIYTTFLGYDEIAHHSGPDSPEAYRCLTAIDGSIRKIYETIQSGASRPYELVILSDHGQSYGPTFLMRYGETIGDYIKTLASTHSAPQLEPNVVGIGYSEDNSGNVLAVLKTLNKGKKSNRIYESIEESLQENEDKKETIGQRSGNNDILMLASGNLANVYFPDMKQRMSYADMEEFYPGLIRELVSHPGVGVAVVLTDGEPVAYGKEGKRNLYTGEIEGKDPLEMYEDADKRVRQLRYLSDFPEVGDLILGV